MNRDEVTRLKGEGLRLHLRLLPALNFLPGLDYLSICLQALTQCQTNEKSPSPPQLNAYFSSYPADREGKQKRLTCFNWRKECPMTQAFACSGFGDKNWLGDSEVLNQSWILHFQVVLERGNGKAKNQADWMKANNFIASQPECLLPAPNLDDFISCALFTLFLLIHWSKTTLAWKDSWINKVLQLKTEQNVPFATQGRYLS